MNYNQQARFQRIGIAAVIAVPVIIIAIVLFKGVTLPWQLPPSTEQLQEQEAANYARRLQNSTEAKATLLHLREAARSFRQRYGLWPHTLDELPRTNWAAIPPHVSKCWTFEIQDGYEILIATSTDAMPDSAGKTITLSLNDNSWGGYGIEAPPERQPVAKNEE